MDKERDVVAADITDIVLTSAEYYWWAGHNDFEFTCKIRGENDVINMHMYRHDEGYGVTVHSEKDDIWDRMWPNEIRKLDDKLQEAIQYGEYHKRIENLKTSDECDEMEFEFMENDDYYFRLSLSKLWKELNEKRKSFEHPAKESIKEKLEKNKSEVKTEVGDVENTRKNKGKAVREISLFSQIKVDFMASFGDNYSNELFTEVPYMSRGSNQKFKFTYLMKIMQEKTDDTHALTMPQILDELEKYGVTAERKSIYTDFDDMEKFGIDIIKEQIGRETFYHVGSREFELAEVKLLIDAIQSSKFITERKSRELIKKIKNFVSSYQASQLQRQIFVHGRIKTMNETIYYSVDEIHNAIANNQKIKFKYFSWQADKTQWILNKGDYITVSPWALTWDDENYYLVAYDDYSKTCKHYRVDKMIKPQAIDEKREGEEQFRDLDMAVYSKATFGMYGGEKKRVKIQFHNKMSGVFIDRFGKDITIKPLDEKHSELNVDVFISPQFYGWIFGLGKDVKVVGPDEVVEEMRQKAEEFLKNLG